MDSPNSRASHGTGPVTYVPFRAFGLPGSRTDLCLEVTTINDPAGTVLAIDRIHGFIEIVNADGSGPGGAGPWRYPAGRLHTGRCPGRAGCRLRPADVG